jgi:hypothetical protein
MFAVVAYPGLWREILPLAKRYGPMSSRAGNLIIAAGVVVLLVGLIVLPAALGEHPDTSLLALGACGVSLGSITAASGIYIKARAMQPTGGSETSSSSATSKSSARRVRGGCDICHGDLPVIHCKVHQVHLCPDCLGQHYDFRTCTYAPSTRGTKAAKNIAKARGA